jgi:hypothetical protein
VASFETEHTGTGVNSGAQRLNGQSLSRCIIDGQQHIARPQTSKLSMHEQDMHRVCRTKPQDNVTKATPKPAKEREASQSQDSNDMAAAVIPGAHGFNEATK